MFIQLHEVNHDNTLDKNKPILANEQNNGIFILVANYNKKKLYISRSFPDYNINKYTSSNKEHAIVYFNRQSALESIKTSFNYTGLSLSIERIPISKRSKAEAQKADTIKKLAKKKTDGSENQNHGNNSTTQKKY